jgi:hypothetical protein
VPIFRVFVATDCFVETCLATGRFGAPIPNSGSWSMAAFHIDELLVT